MPTGAGPPDPEGWGVIALRLPLPTDLLTLFKSGAGGVEYVHHITILTPQRFIPSHGPEVKPGNYSRSFLVKKLGKLYLLKLNGKS